MVTSCLNWESGNSVAPGQGWRRTETTQPPPPSPAPPCSAPPCPALSLPCPAPSPPSPAPPLPCFAFGLGGGGNLVCARPRRGGGASRLSQWVPAGWADRSTVAGVTRVRPRPTGPWLWRAAECRWSGEPGCLPAAFARCPSGVCGGGRAAHSDSCCCCS